MLSTKNLNSLELHTDSVDCGWRLNNETTSGKICHFVFNTNMQTVSKAISLFAPLIVSSSIPLVTQRSSANSHSMPSARILLFVLYNYYIFSDIVPGRDSNLHVLSIKQWAVTKTLPFKLYTRQTPLKFSTLTKLS